MGRAAATLNDAAAPPWQSRSPALRVGAAVAAVAATLGGLSVLQTRPRIDAALPSGAVLIFPVAPVPRRISTRPSTPPTRLADTRAPSRIARPPLTARPSPSTTTPADAAPQGADNETTTAATAAAAPRSASSAPLRLDAATLGRAFATSEGAVRGMARKSGVVLDTPRLSQSQQLADAVAKTAIPDCLAPNAGGSLLSIPMIAYAALEGHCK